MAETEKVETLPRWGYHKDGRSEIFNLKPGEKLPNGFTDSPAKFKSDKNSGWYEGEAAEPAADPEPEPEPKPEPADDDEAETE